MMCRHTQKHSSDELLRLQCRQRQSWRPLPSVAPQDAALSPDYLSQSLKDAMFFYETLQACLLLMHRLQARWY